MLLNLKFEVLMNLITIEKSLHFLAVVLVFRDFDLFSVNRTEDGYLIFSRQ